MVQQTNHITKGHSINRLLYFNGEDYPYWKDRIRLFIEFTSIDMWEIIENGDYIPTIEQPVPQVVADPDQPPLVVVRLVLRNQWTDQHKAKVQMNAKAKNLLTCALSKSEYDNIISYNLAKEIWEKLQVLHEGIDQVKETKISMSVHQYEMFKMVEHENIDEMTTRFMHIINQLKALRKRYIIHKW